MNRSQQRRLVIVIIGIHFAAAIIIGPLVAFQVVNAQYWVKEGDKFHNVIVTAQLYSHCRIYLVIHDYFVLYHF